FQAEDGIRDLIVTGVQTCALPIWSPMSTPTSTVFFSAYTTEPSGSASTKGRNAFERFRSPNMSSMRPTTPAPRQALSAAKNMEAEADGTANAETTPTPT